MKSDEASNILFGNCKKAKRETVQELVMMSRNVRIGKPLCLKVPSEIVGDILQRKLLKPTAIQQATKCCGIETDMNTQVMGEDTHTDLRTHGGCTTEYLY